MKNKTLWPVITVLGVIVQIPCGIMLDFSAYWLFNTVITCLGCLVTVYANSGDKPYGA